MEEQRASSTVTIFLQDCDTGHPVSVTREVKEDPDSDLQRKSFTDLARAPAVKDASLALLASGQLVTQGGKRKASGKLVIGRARAAVNPQNFAWDQLKAPVLAEDIGEIIARLRLLPPRVFRPRSTAGDFHVCPIVSVSNAGFDPISNSVFAVAEDRSGNHLQISHPWTERGMGGAEKLLNALTSGSPPQFVAGHVTLTDEGITFSPTAYVFKHDGASRVVLPWLDSFEDFQNKGSTSTPTKRSESSLGKRHSNQLEATEHFASEIALNGITKIRRQDSIQRLVKEIEGGGYQRLADLMRRTECNGSSACLELFKWLTLARTMDE